MDKILELDKLAEDNDIEILKIKADKCRSMSLKTDSGKCYIGINKSHMTKAEETVCKAHELGHCETESFYNRYSRFDLVSRNEHRADVWAIKKLIDKSDILSAFKKGITEIWSLAEYFEVTEDFMRKACVYYGFM